MNSLVITLLCDATLAILLAVTIGYCARLSKRIRLLQDGRSELGEMIARFDTSTQRAMASLAELQTVSKKITEALQIKIEKANFIADDLAFLIEKGTKLANQKSAPQLPPEAVKPVTKEPTRYFEEFVAPKPASPAPMQAHAPSQAQLSSIEAVLQRLSTPGAGSTVPNMKTPGISANPNGNMQQARTGAERELLEALKSGR